MYILVCIYVYNVYIYTYIYVHIYICGLGLQILPEWGAVPKALMKFVRVQSRGGLVKAGAHCALK